MDQQTLSQRASDTMEPQSWQQNIAESLLNFASLSKLLRFLGASVIVAALSIYLLQGWQNGDDIHRYLLLLVHTGFLAAIGFVCGHWIKETKGARWFLCLALISVPINAAVLGSLLYSQIQWDTVLSNYPAFANWQTDSLSSALLTSATGIVVLIPIVWISFLAIARRSVLPLTGMFLAGNSLLLVPLRDPTTIGFLLVAVAGLWAWHLLRLARRDLTLKTTEGRFAQLLQILPLGVLALREMMFYPMDAVLYACVALIIFILFRQISLSTASTSHWRKFMEQLSLVPAAIAAIWIAVFAADVFPNTPALPLPVFGLCFSSLIIEISLRSPNYGAALRRFASGLIMVCMVSNLTLLPGVVNAVLCMTAGIGVIVYGFSAQQRVVFTLGLATLVIGLGYQVHYAAQHSDLGSWGSLATLGVSAILLGSILERHGAPLKQRISIWLGEYRSWNY